MDLNKVYIKQRGSKVNIYIDNVEIKGVRYVNYDNEVQCMPMIKLEFYTDELDISIDKEGEV